MGQEAIARVYTDKWLLVSGIRRVLHCPPVFYVHLRVWFSECLCVYVHYSSALAKAGMQREAIVDGRLTVCVGQPPNQPHLALSLE